MAKKYFENMGYICPARQTTADFLTSLTNPSERVVTPGFEDRVPRSADEFAKRWALSQEKKILVQGIDDFEDQFELSDTHFEKFMTSRKAQQAKLT